MLIKSKKWKAERIAWRKTPEGRRQISTEASRKRRRLHPELVRAEEKAWHDKKTPEQRARYAARDKAYKLAHPESTEANRKRSYLKRRTVNPEMYLFKVVRARARETGKEFSLSVGDITIPTHCPVLGIPLFFSHRFCPNTPSVDRVDNSKGYIPGNIVVISWRANRLKADATIEEIIKIAEFYKSWKATR